MEIIYCLNCKTKTDTLEIKQSKTRNNRLMLQVNVFYVELLNQDLFPLKKEKV